MENSNYSNFEFLAGNSQLRNNESEIERMREAFISQFCNKMGWIKENLTAEQLSIIKKNKQYINPSLLLG